MSTSNFRFPTKIRFGVDSIQDLPEFLTTQNLSRPLIVTDKALVQLSFFKDIITLLEEDLSPKVYSDFGGNPIESHVKEGVKAYKNHNADSLVFIGGGCPMDVGKAIALMVNHPGDLFEYEDEKPGALPVDQKIPYMIAVPTTSGTGSEVGSSAVISDDQTHAKKIIYAPNLIPNQVIADPKLTVDLPANITAATGMDALTHNIEAYLAKNFHPICDGIALEGIRLVHKHLYNAVKNPKSLEDRGGMLMSSMMGAIAFQKGLGVVHSCAHALSTCFDTHHGLANALMLEPCMAFNYEVVPERFATMGEVIGLTGTQEEKAKGFIAWIKDLKEKIGIPQHVDQLKNGVPDELVKTAFADACHPNNPRVCNESDFAKLYEAVKV